MIDLHAHVIYGVDDGAQTLDESLRMVEVWSKYGFSGVVATPHANPLYYPERNELESRRKSIAKHFPNFRILLGYEARIELFEYSEPGYFAIEGTRYILVELPWNANHNYKHTFMKLLEQGYLPILAHPERYVSLEEKLILDLKQLGVGFQINVSSLLGNFGKDIQKRALSLIKHAEFVGSDAHTPEELERLLQRGMEYYEGRTFEEDRS